MLPTKKVYSWIFSGSKPYGNNVGLDYFSFVMTFLLIFFWLCLIFVYLKSIDCEQKKPQKWYVK